TSFSRDWSSDVCSSDLTFQLCAVRDGSCRSMYGAMTSTSALSGNVNPGGSTPTTETVPDWSRSVSDDRSRPPPSTPCQNSWLTRSEERRVGQGSHSQTC